jgi:hypothetical protein
MTGGRDIIPMAVPPLIAHGQNPTIGIGMDIPPGERSTMGVPIDIIGAITKEDAN